ncbi:MAG: hypothetical protein H0T51_25840 [Pirellulales bacterium]|nr:hypothetical protein [Pirellulales bacterium]
MATRFRWIIALIVAIPVCYLLFAAIYSAATWERRHMLNSASRFADWADGYEEPHSLKDAKQSVDMIEYIPHYYVPQDGYRSDPETEEFLAEKREQAIKSLVEGLNRYSGESFGTDTLAWNKWIEQQSNSSPNLR